MIGGRWMDGGSLAREAMVSLGDAWWRDPLGRFVWAIGREVALGERWDDSSDDVRSASWPWAAIRTAPVVRRDTSGR